MKQKIFSGILFTIFTVSAPVLLGAQTTAAALSLAEKEGILLMREEEKLARDVYLAFYDMWKLPVFSNIARSEQTHMDAVKTLIYAFALPDPVKSDARGVFANRELAKLYNDLVLLGKKDISSALTAGARIEELDIFDLERLIEGTKNPEIITVYKNLLKGSRNHIRAFSDQLAK